MKWNTAPVLDESSHLYANVYHVRFKGSLNNNFFNSGATQKHIHWVVQ